MVSSLIENVLDEERLSPERVSEEGLDRPGWLNSVIILVGWL